jgi:CRISPR/Cas system-associated exonuclease Cas4 (RecB family)
MGVTNKDKAKAIKKKNDKQKELQLEVQSEVSRDFHKMLDDFHGLNVNDDYKLDVQILQERIEQMTDGRSNLRGEWDESLPTFSPSGADDCERSLAFKLLEADEDETVMEPYQKRWVRNGSAVHEAMQRDLIYIEKYLPDAPFEVLRTKEGKPAWERNTRTVKQFEHNGVRFQIYGMVDGMLWYKPRKKRIGYDFKTKSTTIATVGDYKLKVPQENNVAQMVAYSLLFDVDEYIIHYESLAKDSWSKGKEARNDMKVFHIKITPEMQNALLDKLAGIVKQLREYTLPAPDFSKCMFCKYKEVCSEVGKGAVE